ncbi:MAG: SMI1/KNR4 family protein [Desulfobacteraceae bacterium]
MDLRFEDYLDINLPGPADVSKAEQTLGLKFPESYKEILLVGAGKRPVNLQPVSPKGTKLGFRCFYHVAFDHDDDTFLANVDEMEAWGYGDKLLTFSDNGGGVRYCLDYREKVEAPPVVIVLLDSERGVESAVRKIAENFDEFLEKYTVPM